MDTPRIAKQLLDETTSNFEAALLGTCICFPEVLHDLFELEPGDFGDFRHLVVFAAIRELEAKGTPIEVLTVEAEVAAAGRLPAIGGVAFLGELTLRFTHRVNVGEYAARVRDGSLRRRVARALDDVLQLAGDPDTTGGELLDAAQRRLGEIDARQPDVRATRVHQVAQAQFELVERVMQRNAEGGAAMTGVPTGIAALDKSTGGWRFKLGNLIAARPGMGKSAFGISTASACSSAGFGMHVFSLEDSLETYGLRILSRGSGVPASRLAAATLRSGEPGACAAAVHALRERYWLVDDRAGLTSTQIVRAWRRCASENRTRVVIVDYLQLVRPADPRMDAHRALGASLQTLIDAAKQDDVALVVMSQLNRELEKREDKRPKISDLRGSGEIEELVKLGVALFRGSYYGGKPLRGVDYDCECHENVKRCHHAPDDARWERQAQLLVLKGGNGPTGIVSATWDGPTMNLY